MKVKERERKRMEGRKQPLTSEGEMIFELHIAATCTIKIEVS